mmetsp:Transcript_119654/g.381856  ORF Transcript_119654/g.381856 Transcript_119654/m.381856 type:complete len:145 (-) Transcript_119654:319-753(-)
MTIMTNCCQYFYNYPLRARDGSYSRTPFYLMVCATFLLLISPLKNLAVNVCMASFKQNGYDATIGPVLDFAYMPVFGERPTRVYTTLGYALMMLGTALQVDLGGKLQHTIRQARSGKATSAAAAAAAAAAAGEPQPATKGPVGC